MALKPAPKRRRYGWRRIHKWIGVIGGAFLLVWIISGIVMSIPGGGATTVSRRALNVDYSLAAVSPSQAIATLSAQGVGEESIRDIRLERLGSRLTYRILLRQGGPALVDAATGQPFAIDAGEALRVATELYGGPGAAGEPELMERHDLRYFQGEVPVYRVDFDDAYRTQFTIAVRSGTVTWMDRSSRFRRYMSAFHDLWPVHPVLGPSSYVTAMVGGGLFALITALTGYWLAFRRGGWRWKRRKRA